MGCLVSLPTEKQKLQMPNKIFRSSLTILKYQSRQLNHAARAVYFAFKSLYLPNFLTKFPTEPEVNLSRRSLRLLHYGRFLKKVIISPYFSLSDGENCPKMHFFGIKLSRLAFSGGKI